MQRYLILSRISKRPNMRALGINAVAQGFNNLLLVGWQKCDVFPPGVAVAAEAAAEAREEAKAEEEEEEANAGAEVEVEVGEEAEVAEGAEELAGEDAESEVGGHLAATETTTDATGRTTRRPFLFPARLAQHLHVQRFDRLEDCVSFVRAQGAEVLGIEIGETAESVETEPFSTSKSVALMPGNEGEGLDERHRSVCDRFVYIPQYGGGTACLNVYVATSLIMHRYSKWYQQQQRQHQKQGAVSASSSSSLSSSSAAPAAEAAAATERVVGTS